MKEADPTDSRYDVIIVGGALAGAASAILLLRERPDTRVLIVEKSTAFGRRVGEATVELSGYFLCRVLGLTQHLNEAHLVKQGMRFWFFNERATSLADCSELGGGYLARVPAFQVDRAVLDEEVLRRAVAAGAELWRPATVNKVQLQSGSEQWVEVRVGEQTRRLAARWVLDASGVSCLLARQEGWWQPTADHPTTAVWARWQGVKDWDSVELAQKYPDWAMACRGMRATATNHFTGDGWWGWCIPLKGGDVSAGAVFDQRLVQWPEDGPLGDRLKGFLAQHPVAREMLSEAKWREGDVHWRKNLPYRVTTHAGDGFVLVGDAAGFLDPMYSPGLDWVSFTVTAATQMILAQQRGEAVAPLVSKHNRNFTRSYQRWFDTLYRDKYEYIGDYDLMRLAFLLDLGLYYLFVASQPFKYGAKVLREPMFSVALSTPFYWFMRTYNRRFAAMAQARRKRNRWGRHNAGRRFMFGGYTFSPASAWPIFKALFGWLRLELAEGWRSWFVVSRKTTQPGTQPNELAINPPLARDGSVGR